MRAKRRVLALSIDAGLCTDRGASRPRTLRCATAALFVAAVVVDAGAATFVVDTTGDPGPGGTTSLRQAVFQANASANNVVQFAPALNGSTITLQNGAIAVTQPMYIMGPGADKLTISGNNASQIFSIGPPSGTIDVTVEGLELTAGHGTAGGALYANHTTLTLRHAVLSDSTVTGSGGGLYCKHSSCQLSDATISGNHASSGGGIGLSYSALDVNYSVISSNVAAGAGGGIEFGDGSSGTLTLTKVVGNAAALSGGGIDVQAFSPANLILDRATVSGNSAGNETGAVGGGIHFDTVGGTLTIRRSLVSSNNAYSQYGPGGGGIAVGQTHQDSTLTLQYSTVAGNYAAVDAGGVFWDSSGDPSFKATLANSTIVANSTGGYATGNGIYAHAGTAQLSGSIIANNFNRGGPASDVEGTFTADHSLIRDEGSATVTSSFVISGVDPNLGLLAENGGPTLSMLPAATSPVIDANDPAITSGTDQRGVPRVAGAHADIGAVERQSPEVIIFRNGFD